MTNCESRRTKESRSPNDEENARRAFGLRSSSLRQPHQIAQELKPDEKQPAPRVSDLALAGLFQDALGQVVRDLRAEVFLDFERNPVRVDLLKVGAEDVVLPQKMGVAFIELQEGLVAAHPVDAKLRHQFQAVRERIVPRRPDRAVLAAR